MSENVMQGYCVCVCVCVFRVSDVAKAFEKLILDDSKNGAALYVNTEGSDYVKFPTSQDLRGGSP